MKGIGKMMASVTIKPHGKKLTPAKSKPIPKQSTCVPVARSSQAQGKTSEHHHIRQRAEPQLQRDIEELSEIAGIDPIETVDQITGSWFRRWSFPEDEPFTIKASTTGQYSALDLARSSFVDMGASPTPSLSLPARVRLLQASCDGTTQHRNPFRELHVDTPGLHTLQCELKMGFEDKDAGRCVTFKIRGVNPATGRAFWTQCIVVDTSVNPWQCSFQITQMWSIATRMRIDVSCPVPATLRGALQLVLIRACDDCLMGETATVW